MVNNKRRCIEVDTGTSGRTGDPIGLFARMLREQHGGSDKVEESNKILLESLIRRGQIPRSSIVWHDEKVSKIYGFRVGEGGKIEYDSQSRSPQKKAIVQAHIAEVPQIDALVLKNAILRSKQMAI